MATYSYDFGDGWEHKVLLEKTLPQKDWQEAHADFDPDDFRVHEVCFDDPLERFKLVEDMTLQRPNNFVPR